MSPMPEESQIYVLTTAEIRELLADNETSLGELLREEGVEVKEQIGENPLREQGSRTKDPVSILVATAGVIASLTPIVSRVLERFSRKPIVVKVQRLLPVLDGAGAPVKDNDGNAITYWAEVSEILKEEKAKIPGSSFDVTGPFSLKLSYQDK